MRHHTSRTLRRVLHHLTPLRQPPPPPPRPLSTLTSLSLSSTLHRLVPPPSIAQFDGKERDAVVRSMGLKIEQLKAELEQLNE